jgi:nicotinate phosphoribosyltransferase
MAALSTDGGPWVPKIKLSENPFKITNPGVKKVYRLYDKESGKMKADLITLADEIIDNTRDLTIFDPLATWKRMTLAAGSFTVRELLEPVFVNGQCVYREKEVMAIREYSLKERDTLWDEHKRLTMPHMMPIDLSQSLYDLKQEMIAEARRIKY